MDRLEEVLEAQLRFLRGAQAMMSTGTMTTRVQGKDATRETMAEYNAHIKEIEDALARHRVRHA
ncbi:MAG: hypothetical protein CVT77_07545 [Alphaproteobacteria bacterium HGW-Alphaproteobacteria-16]|nr:MAG: hypothetical protein CVT77_07545 [Alphaproteobacteria bacterium HGW-Alphaproteobacteria-16]